MYTTSVELIFGIFIATLLVWIIGYFSSFKGYPDPWEKEVSEEDLKDNSIPLCLNCQRPVDNPSQYYCPNCGNVTGDYTRYMPFINIPFNYSIYGKIWRKLKSPDTFILFKAGYFFLILFSAPLMLIAWPFVDFIIYAKQELTSKRKPRDE